MASVTVIKTIAILVVSVLLGIGLFYITNTGTKNNRKQQVETIVSYGIQFVIYLWLGKMIVSFPKMVQDPLAVLAHPGDSKAFYVATCFTLLHIIIQNKRGKVKGAALLTGFVPVFFTTSFFYDFFQIMMDNNQLNLYFVWMMVLSVATIIFYQKNPSAINGSIFMMVWAMGSCLLSLQQGYLVVFGFLLQPVYFIALAVLFAGFIFITRKRKIDIVPGA